MDHPTIYYPDEVRKVRILHQNVLRSSHATIYDQLSAFAKNLHQALRVKNPAGCIEVSNYHPKYIGSSTHKIFKAQLNEADCKLTIARSCSFEDWDAVSALRHKTIDNEFERAVDLLLCGAYYQLKSLLIQSPYLIHQHSDYGHYAGLIHYVTANGVELWRQYLPSNIVDLTQLLLEFGADIDMRSNIYGGTETLLQLLQTSCHPWDAGVGEALVSILKS